MKTETRIIELECKLDDDEVNDRAFEAGQLDQDIQKAEDEFDAVKTEHKDEVKRMEAKRRHLLRDIRTKTTRRDVDCTVEPIYDPAFVVRTTRTDTGEIVHERPMSLDERQGRLRGIGDVEDLEDAAS